MFAAPNSRYPIIILATKAKQLVVTKENTISIKYCFTFTLLKRSNNFLAKNVKIPPTTNVYKRKSPAALAAIDCVAKASAREAAPANTT